MARSSSSSISDAASACCKSLARGSAGRSALLLWAPASSLHRSHVCHDEHNISEVPQHHLLHFTLISCNRNLSTSCALQLQAAQQQKEGKQEG